MMYAARSSSFLCTRFSSVISRKPPPGRAPATLLDRLLGHERHVAQVDGAVVADPVALTALGHGLRYLVPRSLGHGQDDERPAHSVTCRPSRCVSRSSAS